MRLKVRLHTVAFGVIPEQIASCVHAFLHSRLFILIREVKSGHVEFDLVKAVAGENLHSLEFR